MTDAENVSIARFGVTAERGFLPRVDPIARLPSALAEWDGQSLPDEPAFAALAADLKKAQEQRLVGEIAKRINYEYAGAMSKFKGITRKVEAAAGGPYKDLFLASDKIWSDVRLWRIIKGVSAPYTPYYWLAAIDMRQGDAGVDRVPADQASP